MHAVRMVLQQGQTEAGTWMSSIATIQICEKIYVRNADITYALRSLTPVCLFVVLCVHHCCACSSFPGGPIPVVRYNLGGCRPTCIKNLLYIRTMYLFKHIWNLPVYNYVSMVWSLFCWITFFCVWAGAWVYNYLQKIDMGKIYPQIPKDIPAQIASITNSPLMEM